MGGRDDSMGGRDDSMGGRDDSMGGRDDSMGGPDDKQSCHPERAQRTEGTPCSTLRQSTNLQTNPNSITLANKRILNLKLLHLARRIARQLIEKIKSTRQLILRQTLTGKLAQLFKL